MNLSSYKIALIILSLGTFIFLPACPKKKREKNSENTVVDSEGQEFRRDKSIRRVISLSPEMSVCLRQLGSSSLLVGKTSFCPEELPGEVIGTLLSPNLEKIVELKPDLILATKEGNLSEKVIKLKKMGYQVFIGGTKRNFNDIIIQFHTLGKLLGKKEKAREIHEKCNSRLQKVYEKIQAKGKSPSSADEKSSREDKKNKVSPKPQVFFEIAPQPLRAAGPGSFHDDMIRRSGAKNTVEVLKRYPFYSSEKVLASNPDFIVLCYKKNQAQSRKKFWMRFDSLKAGKKGRIICLPLRFSRPTPLDFVEGVERLAAAFHFSPEYKEHTKGGENK